MTSASAAHWFSVRGLGRVEESTDENWQWAFSIADILGKHVASEPAGDLDQLFKVARQVSQLYPRPWKGPWASRPVSGLAAPYFAIPVAFSGTLQGILVLEGVKDSKAIG